MNSHGILPIDSTSRISPIWRPMSLSDTNPSKTAKEAPLRLIPLSDLERLVGLEFIRATEAAALSAYKWMGKGDKESGDFAACDAIRGLFDSVNISGMV